MSEKTYTSAPILTNGKYPISSYLDTTDNTDSQEGSFKPFTQEDLQNLKDLNTKLSSLESKIDGIIDGSTPANTQLTGSNVVKEVVFTRKIRTTTTNRITLTPPSGTRVALIEHVVYGVTGAFESGEGHKVLSGLVSSGSVSGARPFFTVETSESSQYSGHGHYGILFDTGASIGDGKIVRSGGFKIIPMTPYPLLRAQLSISGTFLNGEGIDSELWYIIYYK